MALHHRCGRTIRTHHEFPPIPLRDFDWVAVDDLNYEPGQPVGYGPTEDAAIKDLADQLDTTKD